MCRHPSFFIPITIVWWNVFQLVSQRTTLPSESLRDNQISMFEIECTCVPRACVISVISSLQPLYSYPYSRYDITLSSLCYVTPLLLFFSFFLSYKCYLYLLSISQLITCDQFKEFTDLNSVQIPTHNM